MNKTTRAVSQSPGRRGTGKVPKVLRAERIELVDSEGKVRCRIGTRRHTDRRNPEYSRETTDLDIFDERGRVVVKIAANVETGEAAVTLGDHEHGYASMSTGSTTYQYGAASQQSAEFKLYGGYGGVGSGTEWTARAGQGDWPGTWNRPIKLEWFTKKPPFVNHEQVLDLIVRDAQRGVKKLRDLAGEQRTAGNKREATATYRKARKLEDMIERTVQAFRDRKASEKKAWDAYWKAQHKAEAKAAVAS